MVSALQTNIGRQVSPDDRLSFTIFLASVFHAAIILGVSFTIIEKQPSAHTMEITLAQQLSKNKPIEPDFLAQIDQIGSGTLKEKKLLTSSSFFEINIAET